jgi:hypothetical protein
MASQSSAVMHGDGRLAPADGWRCKRRCRGPREPARPPAPDAGRLPRTSCVSAVSAGRSLLTTLAPLRAWPIAAARPAPESPPAQRQAARPAPLAMIGSGLHVSAKARTGSLALERPPWVGARGVSHEWPFPRWSTSTAEPAAGGNASHAHRAAAPLCGSVTPVGASGYQIISPCPPVESRTHTGAYRARGVSGRSGRQICSVAAPSPLCPGRCPRGLALVVRGR